MIRIKVLFGFILCSFFPVESNFVTDFLYYNIISHSEKCDDKWVTNNITGLEEDLERLVFGQPFVRGLVLSALDLHLRRGHQPEKPLVLSFHGWPGTGKNFVADFIAKHLFRAGLDSKFRKFFSGGHSFPDYSRIDAYKLELKESIERQVELCERSLFVFDEIDKMPPGLFDVVKPFLDHNEHLDNRDYRRSVFIFLSNTGAGEIIMETLRLHELGYSRAQYPYPAFEKHLRQLVYNEGGLKMSSIVKNHLVDYYIPFLPLERRHVRKCIASISWALSAAEPSEETVETILEELPFGPEPTNLFSRTGCKTLPLKVNYYNNIHKWSLRDEL